jgi:hypothetical protein
LAMGSEGSVEPEVPVIDGNCWTFGPIAVINFIRRLEDNPRAGI